MTINTNSQSLNFKSDTVSVHASDSGLVTNWFNIEPGDRHLWLKEAAGFIEQLEQLRNLESEFESLDHRQEQALKQAELLWISKQGPKLKPNVPHRAREVGS